MYRNHTNPARQTLFLTFIGGLIFGAEAFGGEFECMLVQAHLVEQSVPTAAIRGNVFPVGEVVVQGVNFGANPTVYFGGGSEPAEVVSVGRSNNLDSITLKLPPGTKAGTYKLIVQNTTGPFFEDDGKVNPIFCFGSVTIGYVGTAPGS